MSLLNATPFTAVTIYLTGKGQYQANVKRINSDGWTVSIADTPEEALARALSGNKPAPDARPALEEMF